MAMPVQPLSIGVDVANVALVFCSSSKPVVQTPSNTKAAMAAARSATWQPFLQRHLDRGLSKIQAYVALARKLARVAFALLKQQTDYRPKIPQEALT